MNDLFTTVGRVGCPFHQFLSDITKKEKKKPALKEQWKDCGATDRAKAAADQE